MMKKLLVLMLLLGMSSLASAGLVLVADRPIENGVITLKPSETVTLGVDAIGGITGFEFEVRLSNNQAVVLDGTVQFPTPFMFAPYVKGRSERHVDMTGGDFFPKTDPLLPIVRNIVIHCTEETDVIVELIATGANNLPSGVIQKGTVIDSIVLHQIPEPMSLVLLGIGGLFLRRRK